MIRIGLADDNEVFLELLEKQITDCFSSRQVPCWIEKYQDPDALYYDIAERDAFDLCFLDIEMPQTNGIDLAKRIREINESVILIFLTAHPEFIRAGYEVKAFDYLEKDQLEEELPLIMDRILLELEKAAKRIYTITTKYRVEKIPYEDIIYIFKHGQYSKFVCVQRKNAQERENVQERKSLREVMRKLDNDNFFMVERGYVINLNHIRKLQGRDVFLSNGEVICASKERINEMKKQLQKCWIRSRGLE